MKTKTVVESNLDSYTFGHWDDVDCDYTEIDISNIEEWAEKLKCSEQLLGTILENFGGFKDCLLEDLQDIWLKLENN